MTKDNFVNINKTVANLIKSLSARNKDIISRRFGLKNGKKETLESIGKSYSITRERVRQIEESVLGQLTKISGDSPEVQKYVSEAKEILSNRSGVMKESDLFEAFSGSEGDSVVNASLVFVLTLNKELVKFHENDNFYSFWSLNKNYFDSFKNISTSLVSILNKDKKALTKDQLYSLARKNNLSGFDNGQFVENHLNTVLAVNKNLGVNIFDQIGLVSWSEVKPKGVKDKAYLVLKKENSPKHFSEIAKLINVYGFDNKKANVQTVHNELIKDSRFVLVGRGMYALNEWGYKPGTVKDVLVDILKNSPKPMAKAALVDKVKSLRMVKENTILLNLQDSKVFNRKEDGSFTLKEA